MAKRRGLSDEESKLLARAMRDVLPLEPKQHSEKELHVPAPTLRNPPAEKLTSAAGRKAKRAAPPAQVPLDAKMRQKISRGHVAIEARLDLHGLCQDEAHQRLVQFIGNCARRDLRTVLVITGKGSGRGDPAGKGFVMPEGRGVLKANVPRWLAEPVLRTHVWAVCEASPRHGGAGAYYVMLRRRRRSGGAPSRE